MAMQETWFPAYRKLFEPDHHLALGKPACPRFAWLDLCQMATREGRVVSYGHDVIELERGELVASLRTLGDRWSWDKMVVSRFMRLLEKRDSIRAVRETAAGTVYRVVNNDTYWLDEAGERDGNRDRGRDGRETGVRQPRDKNKKVEEGEEGTEKKKNSSSSKKATQLPDDWRPNDYHRDLARSRGVNPEEEAAHFRDHHLAKGSTYKDWDRAFNTWIRRARQFNGPNALHPGSQAAKVKAAGPAAEKPRSPGPRQGAPEASGNGPTVEERRRAMAWGAEHKTEAREVWQEGTSQMGEFFEEVQKRNPEKAQDLAEARFTKLLIEKGVIA